MRCAWVPWTRIPEALELELCGKAIAAVKVSVPSVMKISRSEMQGWYDEGYVIKDRFCSDSQRRYVHLFPRLSKPDWTRTGAFYERVSVSKLDDLL